MYKMTNLLGTVRGSVGSAQTWVSQQWTQRVVQVSVYAAVVFFLLSNYSLIQVVEKSVKSVSGLKLGNDGTLVLHSVIFGLFMYVGTRFILDPILVKAANGRVEGQKNMEMCSQAWVDAVHKAWQPTTTCILTSEAGVPVMQTFTDSNDPGIKLAMENKYTCTTDKPDTIITLACQDGITDSLGPNADTQGLCTGRNASGVRSDLPLSLIKDNPETFGDYNFDDSPEGSECHNYGNGSN